MVAAVGTPNSYELPLRLSPSLKRDCSTSRRLPIRLATCLLLHDLSPFLYHAMRAAPPACLLCAVHGWEVFRNCDAGEWGQKPRFGSPRAAAIAPQSPNPLARGPAPTTGFPRPLHVAVPNGPAICPLTTSILPEPGKITRLRFCRRALS